MLEKKIMILDFISLLKCENLLKKLHVFLCPYTLTQCYTKEMTDQHWV